MPFVVCRLLYVVIPSGSASSRQPTMGILSGCCLLAGWLYWLGMVDWLAVWLAGWMGAVWLAAGAG